MSRWENGKIITEANPVAEGKGKAQKFVREISNDELIQVIYLSVMFIIFLMTTVNKKTNISPLYMYIMCSLKNVSQNILYQI